MVEIYELRDAGVLYIRQNRPLISRTDDPRPPIAKIAFPLSTNFFATDDQDSRSQPAALHMM